MDWGIQFIYVYKWRSKVVRGYKKGYKKKLPKISFLKASFGNTVLRCILRTNPCGWTHITWFLSAEKLILAEELYIGSFFKMEWGTDES